MSVNRKISVAHMSRGDIPILSDGDLMRWFEAYCTALWEEGPFWKCRYRDGREARAGSWQTAIRRTMRGV